MWQLQSDPLCGLRVNLRAIGYFNAAIENDVSLDNLQQTFVEYCHLNLHQPIKTFVSTGDIGGIDDAMYRDVVCYVQDSGSEFLVVVPNASHLGSDLESVVRSLIELDAVGAKVVCFDEDFPDRAVHLGLDLVHHLHRLDDTEHLVGGKLVPDIDAGISVRPGGTVERPHERCGEFHAVGGKRIGAGRGLGCHCGNRQSMHPRWKRHGDRDRHRNPPIFALQTYLFAFFLVLKLNKLVGIHEREDLFQFF